MPGIFAVVHFVKDCSYTICEDTKNNLTIYKQFQFNYPINGKDFWYKGLIVYKGSKTKCEEAAKKIMSGMEYISDSYTESSSDGSLEESKINTTTDIPNGISFA